MKLHKFVSPSYFPYSTLMTLRVTLMTLTLDEEATVCVDDEFVQTLLLRLFYGFTGSLADDNIT